MEKLSFATFTAERDDQFQISTQIVERDGEKTVRKCALSKSGEKHIAQMAANERILRETYKNSPIFQICPVTDQGPGWVEFEYQEGETLENWLDRQIQTGNIEKAKDLLAHFWEALLQTEHTAFTPSEDYVRVFGESIPADVTLHGSVNQDFDLLFSNLFLLEGHTDRLVITDYEWVFPFSVPLEYIYYRSMFFSVALSRSSDEEKAAYYDIAGIRPEQLPVYFAMELSFQSYVTGKTSSIAGHFQRFGRKAYSLAQLEAEVHAYQTEWDTLVSEKEVLHAKPVALIRQDQEKRLETQKLYGGQPDATIVIPTKNGGQLFQQVLDRVFGQVTQYTYEVICVDSGSTDQTLDTIRNSPARLVQIPPEEFGHGKTRNLGAGYGTGEFICFLTQDAMPVHESWLENMLNAMKLDDSIAGGFGRHLPYYQCNFVDERDINAVFAGFGQENTIYWMEDKARYESDQGYRSMLAFFSDNNSCLRRSIWEKYPYPDVEFAEDQIWMRKMIELGYKKVYVPEATVYHSHNYDPSTCFMRYFDEYKGLYEIHGYVNLKYWWLIPAAVGKHMLSDMRYIGAQNVSLKKKLGMTRYALRRHVARYTGGYIGGHYHEKSPEKQEKLDRKYSQQYRQRNGIK